MYSYFGLFSYTYFENKSVDYTSTGFALMHDANYIDKLNNFMTSCNITEELNVIDTTFPDLIA